PKGAWARLTALSGVRAANGSRCSSASTVVSRCMALTALRPPSLRHFQVPDTGAETTRSTCSGLPTSGCSSNRVSTAARPAAISLVQRARTRGVLGLSVSVPLTAWPRNGYQKSGGWVPHGACWAREESGARSGEEGGPLLSLLAPRSSTLLSAARAGDVVRT